MKQPVLSTGTVVQEHRKDHLAEKTNKRQNRENSFEFKTLSEVTALKKRIFLHAPRLTESKLDLLLKKERLKFINVPFNLIKSKLRI